MLVRGDMITKTIPDLPRLSSSTISHNTPLFPLSAGIIIVLKQTVATRSKIILTTTQFIIRLLAHKSWPQKFVFLTAASAFFPLIYSFNKVLNLVSIIWKNDYMITVGSFFNMRIHLFSNLPITYSKNRD